MLTYRREIDGLRAVAVLPVIFFHAGFEWFGGGFIGVDVFFVISGYLITSIILAEKQAGRFTLVGFYERRARRILPALFFVVLVCVPFAWFWMLPMDLMEFSQSLIAVPLFASNILFWMQSDYFDTNAELKPLLHTWSLAVEPSAAFYLLPTRGWELLIGMFIAFHHFHGGTAKLTPQGVAQPASRSLCAGTDAGDRPHPHVCPPANAGRETAGQQTAGRHRLDELQRLSVAPTAACLRPLTP